MVQVALLDPEIPQNTGNIVRLCAACGAGLHLVGRLGYTLDDAKLKRAGLDYWRSVVVGVHRDLESLASAVPPERWLLFSKKGKTRYDLVSYEDDHLLFFGPESTGFSEQLLELHQERSVHIPISDRVRSLNLAAAVHVAVYEGLRQRNFQNFA
jgi:tRNA (cytidine/uridine-2'-O-)-methyltransferase